MDLMIRLQGEAEAAGGKVHQLMGNHEMMILCAYVFRGDDRGREIYNQWLRWGGIEHDLDHLDDSRRMAHAVTSHGDGG